MAGNNPVSLRMSDETLAVVDSLARANLKTRSEVVRSFIHGSAPQGGVWVVGYHGGPPFGIYASEIEALRVLNDGMGQFVKFWPWGERPEGF